MDYLYTKRRVRIADIEDGSVSRSVEDSGDAIHILTLYGQYDEYADIVEIDNNRLPLPEREFVIDADDLLHIRGIKFRPVNILTRAECNTIAGRTKLLEWEQSRPYIDDDKEVSGFRMEAAPMHGKPFTKTTKHTPQDTIEYILFVNYSEFIPSPTQNYIYNGLWTWDTSRGLLSRASACEGYHPDLMFAAIEGHDIANRDEFRQVVERYAVDVDFDATQSSSKRNRITLTREQVVGKLMEIYDNSQHLIDCLFATYELFRTENYSSIANKPFIVQRVAIRNYLSTFKAYNSKSGLNTRISNATPIRYKGAVAANVRRRLNIPDEVFNYANKTFRVEPLTDERELKIAHGERTKTKDFIAVGTTVFDQRSDGLKNRQLTLFEDDLGVIKLEDTPLSIEKLLSWVVFDTKQFKFLNEVLFAVASRNNFDWEDYAHRVMMVRTTKDILSLYKEPAQIEINDILRHLFGKVSDKARKDFEQIFDSLPREYFKFPMYIDKKTKNGEVIRIKVDEKDRQKFVKKGYKDLTIYGKRFNLLNIIEEKAANGKPKYSAVIQVNPIYYANMIDKYGNPTNYQKIDDGLRTFISSLNKTDVVTPAVYKILFPIHRQCFASAAQVAREAKKNNKQKGYDYDTERAQRFTRSISKDDLYSAVLRNAGLNPTDTKTKQRIKTKIADALEMMQTNGVCIDTFATSADGRSWNIIFIDPSK